MLAVTINVVCVYCIFFIVNAPSLIAKAIL